MFPPCLLTIVYAEKTDHDNSYLRTVRLYAVGQPGITDNRSVNKQHQSNSSLAIPKLTAVLIFEMIQLFP